LPDGFFSDQKSYLDIFCRTLEWKMLMYVYSGFEYYTTIWCMLWALDNFGMSSVYFSPLRYIVLRKIW
jgi:hypothetical protein